MRGFFYACSYFFDQGLFVHQQILNVAIWLLFQTINANAEKEQRQVVFKIKEEALLYDDNPISVEKSDSLISCSRCCTRDKRCKSANFIEEGKTCSLLTKTQKTYSQMLQKQFGAIHLDKVLIRKNISF